MRSPYEGNEVARTTIKEETQSDDSSLLQRNVASSEAVARLSRERVLGLLLAHRSCQIGRTHAPTLEHLWDVADEMGHAVSIDESAALRQELTTAPTLSELRRCETLSGVA